MPPYVDKRTRGQRIREPFEVLAGLAFFGLLAWIVLRVFWFLI